MNMCDKFHHRMLSIFRVTAVWKMTFTRACKIMITRTRITAIVRANTRKANLYLILMWSDIRDRNFDMSIWNFAFYARFSSLTARIYSITEQTILYIILKVVNTELKYEISCRYLENQESNWSFSKAYAYVIVLVYSYSTVVG